MICESQTKCKNCQDDIKCYEHCIKYNYEQNENAKNNFELIDIQNHILKI